VVVKRSFMRRLKHRLFSSSRAQQAHFKPHHHRIAMQPYGAGGDAGSTLIA
jgi:hypothetical protein